MKYPNPNHVDAAGQQIFPPRGMGLLGYEFHTPGPRWSSGSGGTEVKKKRHFLGVRLEFKPQDFWLGAYWDKENLWICLLPMLPIHFRWDKP